MKISLFFIAFACMSTMGLAQFSATMKNVMSGNERIYQVYNDGENYRYEFTEDGTAGVVIVKPSENKTSILMTDKKYVHHTTCDDMMSRMNDPVQALALYQQQGTVKDEGEEKVGDYTCKKSSISQGDTRMFTVWHAEKLNFPIKIENHLTPDTHMELMDIVSWDVDESYFEVPDGYTEVDDEMQPIQQEPPPPETWTVVKKSLPVNTTLTTGERLMIDIETSGTYKLVVENNSVNPAKFIRSIWRDGEQLPIEQQGPIDFRTKQLKNGEGFSGSFHWEVGQQVVLEGYYGEVSMEVFAE